MNSKLTLKLDSQVIEKAKVYSAEKGKSLSKMVEDYFKSLPSEKQSQIDIEITPVVKSLSGIIDEKSYEAAKDSYSDYLINKYG